MIAAPPLPAEGSPVSQAGLLRKLLSFHMMLAAGLGVITFLTVKGRFDDPDLWWHLKVGQIVWNTHAIPTTDVFSYTAQGHSWTAHEWLAQWSIYGTYLAGGYTGLMLWLAVLGSAIFATVYAVCWLRSENALVAFVGGILAWFFGTVGLAIRPLILGHVFLAAELLFLELGRTRSRRWLWFLPPLFALWVNCHASYFFGMGVLGIYWICSHVSGQWGCIFSEAWEKNGCKMLGVILLLCGVALCANPVGARILWYPVNTLFEQTNGMNLVQEWLPPDLRGPRTLGMFAVVGAIGLFGLLRRCKLPLADLIVLLTAFGLATQHDRMAFIFGLVAAPLFCQLLGSEWGNDSRREHPVLNGILILCGIAAIIGGFPKPAAIQEQIRRASPVEAVNFIRRTGLRGPMLNEYVFGGYLIWALPEEKVFIDGRADVFDWTGVFDEYRRWTSLEEDPTLLLNKRNIRFCLLAKSSPLAQVIPHLAGWHPVYSDAVAVVFAR